MSKTTAEVACTLHARLIALLRATLDDADAMQALPDDTLLQFWPDQTGEVAGASLDSLRDALTTLAVVGDALLPRFDNLAPAEVHDSLNHVVVSVIDWAGEDGLELTVPDLDDADPSAVVVEPTGESA